MLKSSEYYKNLIKQYPDNNEAKFHLGLAYLMGKDYKNGWEYFEHRLDGLNDLFPDFIPLWDGGDISNQTILVYGERGFGDTIMFSRFLPMLATKCNKVLFYPNPELNTLFNSEALKVKTIQNIREELFTVHTSIMSLPYKLGLSNEEALSKTSKSYININKDKLEFYKNKYFQNNNLKIGINWRGALKPTPERSMPIEYFKKLFNIPNITFYSLQTGINDNETNIIQENNVSDLGSTFKNFSDTAAAIENLDLIISNDTSVANLAGTMEKQCWILLPYRHDWRWSNDLSYCIWYKNTILIKQTVIDNWNNVFDIVYNKLRILNNKETKSPN